MDETGSIPSRSTAWTGAGRNYSWRPYTAHTVTDLPEGIKISRLSRSWSDPELVVAELRCRAVANRTLPSCLAPDLIIPSDRPGCPRLDLRSEGDYPLPIRSRTSPRAFLDMATRSFLRPAAPRPSGTYVKARGKLRVAISQESRGDVLDPEFGSDNSPSLLSQVSAAGWSDGYQGPGEAAGNRPFGHGAGHRSLATTQLRSAPAALKDALILIPSGRSVTSVCGVRPPAGSSGRFQSRRCSRRNRPGLVHDHDQVDEMPGRVLGTFVVEIHLVVGGSDLDGGEYVSDQSLAPGSSTAKRRHRAAGA